MSSSRPTATPDVPEQPAIPFVPFLRYVTTLLEKESYFLMLIRSILLVAVAASLSAQAPAPPAQAKLATNDVRETPRGALIGYLDACREGDYRRAASFLIFVGNTDDQILPKLSLSNSNRSLIVSCSKIRAPSATLLKVT